MTKVKSKPLLKVEKGKEQSLISSLEDYSYKFGCPVEYSRNRTGETLSLRPQNTKAGIINIIHSLPAAEKSHIKAYYTIDGKERVIIDAVSNDSGRSESAIASILRQQLDVLCAE